MAHHLSTNDRRYIDARLDDIERDPLGYSTKGELRDRLNRLLAGAPNYTSAEVDALRLAVGLEPVDPLRAAANRAAVKAGVALRYDGTQCLVQTRLNPLCVGRYPTRSDLYDAELNAAKARLARFVHALADEGVAIRPAYDVVVDPSGFVDQQMTLAAVAELQVAA